MTVRYDVTADGDADAIQAGDVVVDLASGKALQVVSKSATPAGEHDQTRSDATAEMFDADADEPVFNCVFLPDGERVSPPSKTYAYPESRLLRYPVEDAGDGKRIQHHLIAAILTDLAEAVAGTPADMADPDPGVQFARLVEDTYGTDLADIVHEYIEASGVTA